MKIAVFVGSLQKKSHNKYLARALENLAPEDVEFDYVDVGSVPLFSEDLEAEFPKPAQDIKDKVLAADAVLFVTPEYNRSIPGVLKNAIDWTSRPFGQSAFRGKPAGIVGATITPGGTAIAQSDLRHILLFLDMIVLGQPEIYMANATEVFDESGNLTDERWQKNLKRYMATFVEWVRKHQ